MIPQPLLRRQPRRKCRGRGTHVNIYNNKQQWKIAYHENAFLDDRTLLLFGLLGQKLFLGVFNVKLIGCWCWWLKRGNSPHSRWWRWLCNRKSITLFFCGPLEEHQIKKSYAFRCRFVLHFAMACRNSRCGSYCFVGSLPSNSASLSSSAVKIPGMQSSWPFHWAQDTRWSATVQRRLLLGWSKQLRIVLWWCCCWWCWYWRRHGVTDGTPTITFLHRFDDEFRTELSAAGTPNSIEQKTL